MSVKADFYTHVGNVYRSSMMTITGAHVMKNHVQVLIVLTLVPHMRFASMYRVTLYIVTTR